MHNLKKINFILIFLITILFCPNAIGQNVRVMESGKASNWGQKDLKFSIPRVQYQNSVSGKFDRFSGDEVFIFSKSGRNIYYYRDSDGKWEEKIDVFNKKSINGYDFVVKGDFNSDGTDDLFFLSKEGQNRFFIKEKGRFNWRMEEFSFNITTVNEYDNVVVGDFNSDGKDDIFFVSRKGKNRFLLREKNGFNWSKPEFSFAVNTVDDYDFVVASDFNSDGHDDLFFLSREGRNRFILRSPNKIDWTVSNFSFNEETVNEFDLLTVGDFNQDEREDLFLLKKDGKNRIFFRNINESDWTAHDDFFKTNSVNNYDFICSGSYSNASKRGHDLLFIPQNDLSLEFPSAKIIYGYPGKNIDIYEAYNLSGTVYVFMRNYELEPATCKFWNQGLKNDHYGFKTGFFEKNFVNFFHLRAGHIQEETIFFVTDNVTIANSYKKKF